MKRAGMTVRGNLWCKACYAEWSPNRIAGGKIPRGGLTCPYCEEQHRSPQGFTEIPSDIQDAKANIMHAVLDDAGF
jgi:hypothetical protein